MIPVSEAIIHLFFQPSLLVKFSIYPALLIVDIETQPDAAHYVKNH